MTLSPQDMTLFQLKRAIEVHKQNITKLERTISPKKGLTLNPIPADISKRLSRYRSALKVCEFTLQRKTDALKKESGKSIQSQRIEFMRLFKEHLYIKFSREDHEQLFKKVSDFIQNYNEL